MARLKPETFKIQCISVAAIEAGIKEARRLDKPKNREKGLLELSPRKLGDISKIYSKQNMYSCMYRKGEKDTGL